MSDLPPYVSVPPGYIVLSRSDYDEMIEQRIASRNDRIGEQMKYDEELSRLHGFLEEKQNEILMLHDQVDENKHTIETLRHQIYSLSTAKEDLMRDIRNRDGFIQWLNCQENYKEWLETHHLWESLAQEPIDAALEEVRGT